MYIIGSCALFFHLKKDLKMERVINDIDVCMSDNEKNIFDSWNNVGN